MKITMLGTGNAFVTECYNTCFVISDGDRHLMVDGGGGSGIFAQLKHAGFDWHDMRDIFVTHKHLDHIMGIIWMVRAITQGMSQGGYEGEATIYAHDEVIDILREAAGRLLPAKMTRFIDDRLHLVEVRDGEVIDVIGHKLTCFDIHSTKAKQFGFALDLGDGRRLTCCGDEPCAESCYDYARGSAWMLHEAFCLYAERDIWHPYEKHHSTARDAAALAESLGVRNLLLYHTEDATIARRRELYAAEAREQFSGQVVVPDDLEVIEL